MESCSWPKQGVLNSWGQVSQCSSDIVLYLFVVSLCSISGMAPSGLIDFIYDGSELRDACSKDRKKSRVDGVLLFMTWLHKSHGVLSTAFCSFEEVTEASPQSRGVRLDSTFWWKSVNQRTCKYVLKASLIQSLF